MRLTSVNHKSFLRRVFTVALALCLVLGSFPLSVLIAAEAAEPTIMQLHNIVSNPGFEDGQTAPTGWKFWTIGGGNMLWDTEQKYEGSKSAKLMIKSGERSILDQEFIALDPSASYQLSSFAKTENWTGAARIELYYFMEDKKTLVPNAYKYYTLPKGTNDWKKYDVPALTPPAGASYARIRLNIMSGEGSVWFDNVSLTKLAGPNDLSYITLNTEKTMLSVSESTYIAVRGTLGNGSSADLSSAVISYNSDNNSVAAVNNGIITAISGGIANISASVTLNGITETASITINVIGDVQSVKYNFKDGISSTIEANGWKVGGSNTTYRNQPYGIQVQSGKIGDYITFEINVPDNGYYTLKLVGAGSSGGAITDLFLDDIYVGQIDFYSAVYVPAQPPVLLKTLALGKGIHEFTMRVSGKSQSWGYNMYPGELELAGQKSLPVFESIETSISAQNLAVGQTAKISVAGVMSNGYRDILKGSDTVRSLTSVDASIAAVDSNGIVRAVKPGTTEIVVKATIYGVTREAVIPVTVNEKILKTVEVTLSKSAIPVGITTTAAIAAKLDDGSSIDLRDAIFKFSSDNEQAASVDEKGKVTALKEGTANIKAEVTLGNTTVTGQALLEVVPLGLDTITVTSNKSSLFVGRQAILTVTGKLNNGQDADMSKAAILYESSDVSVIEIDSRGAALAKKPGTVRISVSVTLDGVTKYDNSIIITVESTEDVESSKTRQTYYTPEKISASHENIEKYDWAKAIKDGAVEEADRYVDQAELLWNIVTPQNIPRGILVNSTYTCPSCGKDLRAKYGNYPWVIDPVNDPWKVKCPDCGIRFPSNDFGAYYNSGLNERGIFDPAKADKSLLVNTLHPEKGEKWGVDDGFGFIDENGKMNSFIAYYNHWGVWYSNGIISKALTALKDAYLYTGDIKYARTGTILLDRIADVYPDMTLDPYGAYLNSHGGTGKGKVIGSIWETSLVQIFITAYDAFFPAMDDQQTINFLINKSAKYDLDNPKNTGALIRKNIEDGIIRQVYPAVKKAEIRGNFGMHQAALALAAVVLDSNPDTKEWLDFTFQAGSFFSGPYRVTGGDVLATLVDKVDRDGHGNEAGPGYNRLWLSQLKEVANALDGYEGYPGADLYKNPKFIKMFSAMYPLTLAERYTAQIGDSGGTGNTGLYLSIADAVDGFIKFGDPVHAQVAYFLNKNSAQGLHANIFIRDPEKVSADIQRVIDEKGVLNLESDNLAGYGFSVLRDGKNYKPFFGYQIAFQNLSPFNSTAGFKLFESSGTIQFEADAPGHSISYTFNVPKTDLYEVDLNPFKSASYGIYDISIDGVKVAAVDFYGGSGANSRLETLVKMDLTEGEHTITFEGIGKNQSATGYKMGVIHLILFDEEAIKLKEDENNTDTQRDFWMYYGRTNISHAHRDQLNLGVHAYGLDIAPDLGYPEETGTQPNRMEWVSNTVSHNTVVVDASKQSDTYDGTPMHFDDSGMVKIMDVDSSKAYLQTEMYRRTLAMIKVDDEISYGVDFFRVKGGNDHYYSFHGAEGAVATEGLNLVAQPTGTYAGPNVEFGVRADSVSGGGYTGSGFHWLKNVQKDENPGSSYSVDWDITDTRGVLKEPLDIHLRLTMLGDVDDVAVMDGQPPKTPGNPQWLKYMIAHRSGENLNSLFTSVIEPYKDSRYVQSISEVPVTADGQAANEDVKAVKVVLNNGRTDYIVNSLDNSIVYTVDGKFQFRGFLGVYSEKDGKQVYGYVNDGDIINKAIEGAPGSVTGTVRSFTQELSTVNELKVELNGDNIDVAALPGRFIYIKNDGMQNAAYKILGIKAQNGNEVTFDLGATTLIRKYIDSSDLNKGFIYNIAQGNEFSIPLSYETADKSGLMLKISDAEALNEEEYTINSYSLLLEKLNAAKALIENPYASSKDVWQAEKELGNAFDSLEVKFAVDEDGSIRVNNGAVTVSDGKASVELTQHKLAIAINNAVISGVNVVYIQIPEINTNQVNTIIPVEALQLAHEKNIEKIIFKTSIAEISIIPEALKNSVTKDAIKAEISISYIDKEQLSPEMIQQARDKIIYDFNIYADGDKVTNFTGMKAIDITLPYYLKVGEDVSDITVFLFDDKGTLEVIKNCIYDGETKTITFRTNKL